MLSLFYKILETQNLKEVFITIFKPDTDNQVILLKGKLGQFKLKWACQKKKEIDKKNIEKTKIYSIWTQNYINEKDFWTFKKENKHFVFSERTKKINDMIFDKSLPLKNETVFNQIKNIKNFGSAVAETNNNIKKVAEEIGNKLHMGYLLPLETTKGRLDSLTKTINLTQEEDKILNKQIKNIITGLTQGFSINLELKGIGYQAKLQNIDVAVEETVTKNKKNTYKLNSEKKGQLESNWKDIGSNIKMEIGAGAGQKNVKKNEELTHEKKKAKEKNIKKELKLKPKLGMIKGPVMARDLQNLTYPKKNEAKKQNNDITTKGRSQKSKENEHLVLNLGTSHNILYPLYKHEVVAKLTTSQNNFVTLAIFSVSWDIIKQVAAKIYLLKKPEPYKGKGIRYDGERFLPKQKQKK